MRIVARTVFPLMALSAMFLVESVEAQTADVQIIHNAPDPGVAVVDVYVNGAKALTNFEFRQATGILPLDAGVVDVGFAGPGSSGPGDIIATVSVDLMADSSYVIMATGALNGSLPANPEAISTALGLEVFAPLTTLASGGQVGLLAYHGVPDAPSVDVRAAGVGILFGDLAFRAYYGYLDVPESSYTLSVTVAGQPGTVVASYTADLAGLGGGTAVVFASGYLADDLALPDFGLYVALNDGTVIQLPQTAVPVKSVSWGKLKTRFGD